MKKRLSSPPNCPDEVEQLQKYPVKRMQYQEQHTYQLAQKINEIIADNSATAWMLQKIAQMLGVAFQADCCCLVAVTSEASYDTINVQWCADNDSLSTQKQILSQDVLEGIVQFADEPFTHGQQSPEGTLPERTLENSLVAGLQDLQLPIKAVLVIPTSFGGKKNGVISLIKSQPYNWSKSDSELLGSIASSVAIAFAQVVQAQLIASQQQYLQNNDKYQKLLKELTLQSRSHLELNQLLTNAIALTAATLEVDRGLVILLRYTNPLFKTRSKGQVPKAKAIVAGEWSKDTETKSESESFWLSECSLCQRAFIDPGKPVIINESTDQNDTSTLVTQLFALEDLPALLLMPLESQGKVLGFLVLQQTVARHWQPGELNFLEMVAAVVSNAIIQTQTLRQVQSLVDERTAQLQGSLEVQAKLYEKTRQYVEQLRELNQLKDEFLSNMSDRLRYPLTNMRMAIRNLRQPGVAPERQAKYLDILEQQCTQEINLINDLLTLQQLETHQERPQLETINLNDKMQHIAATFEKKLADNGLSISLSLPQEPLTLETEVESFERILQELLSNTCKYSEQDTIVNLQVTQQVNQKTDQVIIRVTNIGCGISEEEATYIFDKFRRGKGRWTPGTGLGLALVKSLVQHLSGAIATESTQLSDSNLSQICFTLTLPQFSDQSEPYCESD